MAYSNNPSNKQQNQTNTTNTNNIMSIWQLSWNPKNYNAVERLQLALQDEKYKTITQSWGRSSTKNISKIKAGDVIYISCAKKCVAK